uniref:PAS domain-containing protein n=1 Tax=Desertifilum tharense IPPAS B-1220 TaxID=1781255 RepID=A0ACD5GV48_9CYAN
MGSLAGLEMVSFPGWLAWIPYSLPILLAGILYGKQRLLLEDRPGAFCSPNRCEAWLEAAGAIAWVASPTGEMLQEQPQWSAFTGQPYEALKGWGWLNAIHPDDRDRTLEQWQTAVLQRTPFEFERRVRQANGEYCLMRSSAEVHFRGRWQAARMGGSRVKSGFSWIGRNRSACISINPASDHYCSSSNCDRAFRRAKTLHCSQSKMAI